MNTQEPSDPALLKDIPALSVTGLFNPFTSIPTAIFIAIVIFGPGDVLRQNRSLSAFTTLMVSKFPMLADPPMATAFPEAALLANSFSVAAFPFMALGFLGISVVNFPVVRARARAFGNLPPQELLAVLFLGTPVALLLWMVQLGLAPDPSWAATMTPKTRPGFAFIGAVMLWASAASVGNMPLYVAILLDQVFSKPRT